MDLAMDLAKSAGVDVDAPAMDSLPKRLLGIVIGRGMEIEKRKQMTALVVAEIIKGGKLYYHNDFKTHKTCYYFEDSSKELMLISSDIFATKLAELTGISRKEKAFEHFIVGIADEALSHGLGVVPATYWTSKDSKIYISCGTGRIAKIEEGKWTMVDNGTDGVLFERSVLNAWTPTEPKNPFDCNIFAGANTTAHGKLLTMLWTIAMPWNPKNKPPLVTTGDIGSGKTRMQVGLAELWGLPINVVKCDDSTDEQFWTQVNSGGFYILDNCDVKNKWLADAIEAYSTGAGKNKRQLYTDNNIISLKPEAWLGLTSANPTFASAPALADRILVVRMNRRTGETSDASLSREIADARNAGISWMCGILAEALADKTATRQTIKRHPDWGDFAIRIGRALGVEEMAYQTLEDAEQDKSLFNLENDWLGQTLLQAIDSPWTGTTAALKDFLAPHGIQDDISAKSIGKHLQALRPHLEAVFNASSETDKVLNKLKWTFQPPKKSKEAVVTGLPGLKCIFDKNPYNPSQESFQKTGFQTRKPGEGKEAAAKTAEISYIEVSKEEEAMYAQAKTEGRVLRVVNDADWNGMLEKTNGTASSLKTNERTKI